MTQQKVVLTQESESAESATDPMLNISVATEKTQVQPSGIVYEGSYNTTPGTTPADTPGSTPAKPEYLQNLV